MLITDLAERGDDFTLLQETYVDRSGKAEKFNKQWGSQGYWYFGTNKCAGVGILTQANSKFKGFTISTGHSRKSHELVGH